MLKYLICILMLTSCVQRSKEEIHFFENTNIVKSKKIYTSQKDLLAGNYIEKTFNMNGMLQSEAEFKNNVLNGRFIGYYGNEYIVKSETSYKNGVKNGIDRFFNEKGILITERVFLNDKAILLKNYTKFILNDSVFGYSIFRLKNDSSYYREGAIVLDSKLLPIDSLSFYYFSNISDTLELNVSNTFSIYFLLEGEFAHVNTKVFFGNINNKFVVEDTISVFENKTGDRKLRCYFTPLQSGFQLLTGQIQLETINPKDSTEAMYEEMTFYKEIFVE